MNIFDRLPYSTEPTTVTVRGEAVRVKPHQIVVQVSIGVRALLEFDPRTPSFPAILDTGNNHNFAIGRGQLIRWAGIQPEALRLRATMREGGKRVPLHAAALWLHPNASEKHESRNQEPFLLKVEDGIAIYPDDTAPRLPILGLRALTRNQLQLAIDGERCEVSLRTPDWISGLSRWLGRLR